MIVIILEAANSNWLKSSVFSLQLLSASFIDLTLLQSPNPCQPSNAADFRTYLNDGFWLELLGVRGFSE